MKIDLMREGKSLVIKPIGKLTTVTAPELEKIIKDVLFEIQKLTVDMSELEYVSSAGLRVLLMAHKAMLDKQGMHVLHVNEVVKEIFDITGFSSILNIE